MRKYMEKEMEIVKERLGKVLDVISEQGHSGFSIRYLVNNITNNINMSSHLYEDAKEDSMEELMNSNVKEVHKLLVEMSFSEWEIKLLKKLVLFKNITPLTFEDDEWVKHYSMYQNKRNSAVFMKETEKKPYYINAIIFKDSDGITYTSGQINISENETIGSSCFIKDKTKDLKPFVVNTINKEDGSTWVKDLNELKEVSEYYELNIKKI